MISIFHVSSLFYVGSGHSNRYGDAEDEGAGATVITAKGRREKENGFPIEV